MLNIPQEVQDLFLSGTVHKNLRVHFPNGERADITNENIVKESMKFNESLCSRDALKFGMSEASTIEFETVGVENVLGMTIEVGIEVDTSSLSATTIQNIINTWDLFGYEGVLCLEAESDLDYGYYRVPLGAFVVTACPRSHGAMTHRRVIGYSAYFVSGDTLTDFNSWKLNQLYYEDTFEIGEEFLLSNLYGDLPARIVPTYFTQSEPDGESFSVLGNDALFAQLPTTEYHVKNVEESAVTVQAYGCAHQGVKITYDKMYGTPIFQAVMEHAATARAAIRATVVKWVDQYNLDLTDAYYVDEYGRNIYLTEDAFIDRFTDDLIPPIRVVVSTGVGQSYQRNYTYYIRPTEEDFSQILSGAGTYSDTVIYVPTQYGLAQYAYPNWYYYLDGTLGGFWWGLSAESGGNLYDVAPKQQFYSESVQIKSTGSKKEGRRTLYSYTGALNMNAFLDGYFETQGYFGKVSRNGGLLMYYLREMKTGTPASPSSSMSTPVDIALQNVDELWWDEYDIDKIGIVVYIYRDSEADKEYTFTVQIGDADGSVYRMVNNEYIRLYGDNFSADQMDDLLEGSFKDRIEQMGDYTPCEMTMQGMPWVEAGDFLRIDTGAADVPKVYTYMLQRTLTGIQHLEDEIVSVSGEVQINQ